MPSPAPHSITGGLPRRHFLQALAALGAGGAAGTALPAWAQLLPAALTGTPPELRGPNFELTMDYTAIDFDGRRGIATTLNGSLPGPTLRMREGETVTIRVTNRLREMASIHWHGIILPFQMDGVPGVSFAGIAPGETFTYRFTLEQSGTYWYHSHSFMQELTGIYGALIVEPRGGETIRAERDHVVLLSDWTGDDPMRALSRIKASAHVYNQNNPTLVKLLHDARQQGMGAALAERDMWNAMRMSPTDLADLSSRVLTYLVNGQAPGANWTALFKSGERVRLRCINGSGNTFYDLRIPGLKLSVVQKDGQDVEPVTVDEFRIGPGQTCDVIVQPRDEAYTLFAQSMDRTGAAVSTLAVREGLKAPVPALDAVQWLGMADMMGSMEHGAHAGHGDAGAAPMNHGAMDHAAMGHGAMQHGPAPANPLARASTQVRHARTEWGPGTDMRVDMPRTNLDDPGVGLRDNGRRVLTLADLHTLGGPMDSRGAEREIELHLTGNMERYTWSIDGQRFTDSKPVHFRYGERLRVILHNDTMMTHPMHLHGMWQELESPKGEFLARLHTIPVQPAQRLSFLVTADALGRWVWHCHLMFHMDLGMFREVVVS
ncbi:copper resistance system multicopper oxidase [Ottowia sp.]|uniref:copper resistance system multicopper oxidase n=1 Tax=Ottowia sp. TaxID=1898956 RepID=UPI002C884CFE|nr:copper resistance system multicopper oxidase [Ottowia sp.]HRN76517.1 copper resistance system multicopper oxidase [Ottowia sp.]HRQ03715.1 copper resistance system multicopper oxidase [Ottowia sp.]